MTQSPRRIPFKVMPRDWLLFVTVAAWTLVSLLAIFNFVPVRSAIDHARPDGVVHSMQRVLQGVPYIRRVHESMEVHGHPAEEIAAKLQFLTASYLIMLSAYAVAVLGVGLILVAWGAGEDGYTSVLTVLGKRSLGVYWLLMPLVLFADLFVSWLGIHGYRDFFEDSSHRPDMIVSNNGSIVGIVFLLSFSLFCSLTITRFTICYLYARRHAPDIEKEWPLRGVPQVDPTPEIELWQPEKKD